ncbi:hypothetical protein TNCV_2144831 [Trichonephila clavipes]|nr:hypothetical protein TNCV_2144831 [Trichonephila clavipes]
MGLRKTGCSNHEISADIHLDPLFIAYGKDCWNKEMWIPLIFTYQSEPLPVDSLIITCPYGIRYEVEKTAVDRTGQITPWS